MKMFSVQRCTAAAAAVVTSIVVLAAQPAYAAGINNDAECKKALEETQGAYNEYKGLGPKAQIAFADIMKLAQERCDEGEYKKANQLLVIARSMVATD